MSRTTPRSLKTLLALALLASPTSAQVTLIGAGYTNPTAVALSPGQVTTLFVSGLSLRFPSPVFAPSTPLPATLGGISVRFQQGSNTYPFAIFSIKQTQTCVTGTTDECYTTGITVEVPSEINFATFNLSTLSLVISVNGVDSQSMAVAGSYPHLLSNCDSIFAATPPTTMVGLPVCYPLVTHADGSLAFVYSENSTSVVGIGSVQVSAGETIVVYATGLGPTSPAVATGATTPTPAPQVDFSLAQLGFVVSPNVGATVPWSSAYCTSTACPPVAPLPGQPAASAWLVPGQVGLYQINITLPSYTAADLPTLCQLAATRVPAEAMGVYSNVTISFFGGEASLPLCIQPVASSQSNIRPATHK